MCSFHLTEYISQDKCTDIIFQFGTDNVVSQNPPTTG